MFQWEKMGLVFEPQAHPSRPWMQAFAQAPATLAFEKFIRVYFSCRPAPDECGQYVSYSAYVDLDRRDLRRVLAVAEQPILKLGGLGEFDEFGTYPVSVARDGDVVRAFYAGWTRCESVPFNVAIGEAVSVDEGRTFQRIGVGPAIGYSPDEPYVMSGPKVRRFCGAWQLFYIAGRRWKIVSGRPEPVYKIRMATSADGKDWKKAHRDLIPSVLEADEAQASPDVFEAHGRFHMFFCYRASADYRQRAGGYRIGYASSPDLVEWTRDDAKAGLDISESGWDSEMVSYPHVFEVDGAVYMAYLGNQVGRQGFGLAKLKGGWPG